jgi:hypothetical protein
VCRITTLPTGKCIQPAKMNSVDNQPLIHQNLKITGKKPAIPISSHSFLAMAIEMNNKPNMTVKPQHPHNPNTVNPKIH